MNRARDQGMDYHPTHSRQHSRQASDLMPPPPPQMSQMQQNPQEEYASYIMQDNHQIQELEPSANIVQRQMESSPFVPMPYGQPTYRPAAMSCPPFAGVEYSPAPSFNTGHISPDEYAQGRAMTYAPETPPQSQVYGLNNQVPYGLLPTPEASISGDVYTPHNSTSFITKINCRRDGDETCPSSRYGWCRRRDGSPPRLPHLQTTTKENKYLPTHEYGQQRSQQQYAVRS
jgi:hypothetical protein